VAPEVLFHSRSSVDSQRSSYVGYGSGSDSGTTRYKTNPNPRHSIMHDPNSRHWYDELADEESDVGSIPTAEKIRNSVVASSEDDGGARDGNKGAVDQNANKLRTEVPAIDSLKNGASNNKSGGDQSKKTARILAPAERGASRISQKIKFRSKSSSAEKRKDNRRHTLTDMETIKNVLFGSSSRDHHRSVKEKSPPPQTVSAANSQKTLPTASSSGGKQSKKGKLRTWLKESFRKSSPDLYDVDNLENGAAGDDAAKLAT